MSRSYTFAESDRNKFNRCFEPKGNSLPASMLARRNRVPKQSLYSFSVSPRFPSVYPGHVTSPARFE